MKDVVKALVNFIEKAFATCLERRKLNLFCQLSNKMNPIYKKFVKTINLFKFCHTLREEQNYIRKSQLEC